MNPSEIETRFAECFERWKKAVDINSHRSDTAAIRATSEYTDMIELGRPALPYLIQKLREGHFLLNDAVAQITQTNIVKLNQVHSYISEQEISKLWIQWWETSTIKEKIDARKIP